MQEKLYRWAGAKGLDMEEVEMGLEEASARFSRMQVASISRGRASAASAAADARPCVFNVILIINIIIYIMFI